MEKHELQCVASEAIRKDMKTTPTTPDQRSDPNQPGERISGDLQSTQANSHHLRRYFRLAQSATVQKSSGNHKRCYQCKNPSLWASVCPKVQKGEPSGRAKPSSTTSMITPVFLLEMMTDQQWEDILAKRKLERERTRTTA